MVKKVIVCQTGARHRYLIPDILEDEGLLCRLYTDSTCYSTVGKIGKMLLRLGLKKKSLQKLVKRQPQIPREKIYTTDTLFFKERWLRLFKKDSLKLRFQHYRGFANRCKRWGVGDADCVYGMYFENYDYLKYAKAKGLTIIVDIYESPLRVGEVEKELCFHKEFSSFVDIKQANQYSKEVREYYMEKLLKIADYYTVPSPYVYKAIQNYKSFDESKVRLLPYASSIRIKEYNYSPIKHRLIWVGNDPVGKGLIYCAKALDRLLEEYPDIDFRVIGSVDARFRELPAFKRMHFLGTMSKEELIQEYQSAEAYVFPSIGEGLAGTLIEAASCGCPIITTDRSGADEHMFPALFVPVRDVQALVDKITYIFEHPLQRNELSRKVFDCSQIYDSTRYRKDLVNLFKTI